MKTPTKVITALALAGLAVAGGAAFTGGGLTQQAGSTTAFVGGEISTAVAGAQLLDVDYAWDANVTTGSAINTVTLTFDSNTPVGSVVDIDFVKTGTDIEDLWNTITVPSGGIVVFNDSASRPFTPGDEPDAAGTNAGAKVVFPNATSNENISLKVTVTAGSD